MATWKLVIFKLNYCFADKETYLQQMDNLTFSLTKLLTFLFNLDRFALVQSVFTVKYDLLIEVLFVFILQPNDLE